MYADVSLGASAENSRLCEGIYGIEEFHGGDSDVVWPCYFGNWSFAEGVPREGWKKDRGASVPFKLDGCINLDVLCSRAPAEKGAEGVVYADYAVENDGVAFLGIGCNWGFELFCDGVKVATTLPDGNGSTYVFATNHRLFFHVTKGTHLLAFHVFRGEEHWNFAASAGLTVQAPPDPRLAFGPWLCNPDAGRVSVGFMCVTPTGVAVQYRKEGDVDWRTVWHQRQGQCLRRTYHVVPLTGLEGGSRYEYRIIAIHPDSYLETVLSEGHSFTAPGGGRSRYSFFFTADLQFSPETQREYLGNMLEAAKADECDFFVLGGDVNSSFQPENVVGGPFAQLCEHGASARSIIYLRGNHELRGEYGDCFLDYFAQNNGRTYDLITIGDTAFLLLDSWEDKPAKTPGHAYCQWNMDELFLKEEADWLEKTVHDKRWTEAKRRIVICHGAAYSHFDSCKHLPYVLARMTDRYFGGANPAFRVNMWLAGHVHRYMRSIPGTTEIVAESEPPMPQINGLTYNYPVLTVAGPQAGLKNIASCFRVDANEDGFRVRSWNQNGEMLEDVRYENDGALVENKSLLHFILPE